MLRVYMDANATTPLLPEVLDAMRPFFLERFGNASSIHRPGQLARAAVDHARESVAALIGSRSSEIVFTSGGTESDNLALFGILQAGDHLVTSAIEHSAVLHSAEELEKRGVEVTFVACDSTGSILPAQVRAAMRPNTRLVSILLANNETGVLQPTTEFAAIAHEHGALFHTDAVQAVGKVPVDVKALGCDLLSISAHKIHGPQGVGALFVRRSIRVAPLLYGGTHERQRRAGTENVPGIVGMGKAAELAQQWLAGNGPAELAARRDRLESELLRAISGSGVNGADAPRVCNTTNLYFDHVEAEALLIALDMKGLAVSGGSACQSGATEPSHVLLAMGLGVDRARASLRFSLSKLTTDADIDFALRIVPTAVARLRDISPAHQLTTAK
ncbi:MAG: cysteine desulfurase family protein [Acidobacteriaceae bacterium]|nr:cysteine desulfurase family protein [Acidobacteriaceae bacterium]